MYYDPSGHGQTDICPPETAAKPDGTVGNGAKRGPKPKGTGLHNKKIEEIGNQITDGEVIAGVGEITRAKSEYAQWEKSSRRPDILVERPDGSQYGINVGRTTAGGAPVKRDVEALYDLEDADLPMYFVGYDK